MTQKEQEELAETVESQLIVNVLENVGDLLNGFDVDDKKQEIILDWDVMVSLSQAWDEFQEYLNQGAELQ